MGHLSSIKRIIESEIDPAYAKRSWFILKHIIQKKPKHILDAGCGRGFYVHVLSMLPFATKVVGIDINEAYLEKARALNKKRKNVVLKKASLYSLPFENEYFDCVVLSEVLEHVDNDKRALAEVHRVLKLGGTLLVTVPHSNYPFLWDPLNWILGRVFHTHVNKNIWWLAGMWADHERLYTRNSIAKLLKKKGFKISTIEEYVSWCWPFSHFLLYGIGKNLVEKFGIPIGDRFSCSKKPRLSSILSYIMSIPSRTFDARIPRTSSVVITANCTK